MGAGISTERQTRTQHRHELRTLTYITLDQANGGIVRNLNHNGIGAQTVAAVRPQQELRIRFELRKPRVRVEARGEVVWSTFSGQCGIRFINLSPEMRRQMNEWILGDLLESVSLHAEHSGSMFAAPSPDVEIDDNLGLLHEAKSEREDGLLISGVAANVIPLPVTREMTLNNVDSTADWYQQEQGRLDWLSRPLSSKGIAMTVDALAIVAASLLFALVFLSVTREAPPSPIGLAAGSTVLMALLYRGFFWVFGGETLGTRLGRTARRASK